MPADNVFVTPIYATILTVNFASLSKRLILSDYVGAWETLQASYSLLPPTVIQEVTEDYQKFKAGLEAIEQASNDSLFGEYDYYTKKVAYFKQNIYTLTSKIRDSMVKNNYFTTESGRPQTRETPLRGFELDVAKAVFQ